MHQISILDQEDWSNDAENNRKQLFSNVMILQITTVLYFFVFLIK